MWTHPRLTRRAALAGAAAAFSPLPAVALAPSLPFIVLGDWGRGGAHKQREVGAAMGRVAAASGSRFTLSLGDNFYENGIVGPADPQWRDSFEAIYDHPALHAPWHVILGNHDYRGDIEAQIAYRGSARWRLPARYYQRAETLPDGTRADFFHIDTSPFVTGYRGTTTRIEGQDTQAQLRWLDRALAASTATWRIVVGHHPVITATGHKQDTPELMGQLQPLLERHRVQAYLAGHVHNLQETTENGVCYVTSGAGSLLGKVKHMARPGFAVERHGFVLARLSRDAMALDYIDETGRSLRQSLILRS